MTVREQDIITFDYETHKILSEQRIQHRQSEDFLSKDDFDSIEKICYDWSEWFKQKDIEKEIVYQGINLGSLFQWEFHFYLVPIIKKIFEIERISENIESATCRCSLFLKKIAEVFFQNVEIFDKLESKNSFLFDNVKWNLTNNLEISIKKKEFEKIKKLSQKILLNFSTLKERKMDERESIVFVEFDPIKYKKLFSEMKKSKIYPVFFNYRRPYFWNLRSFKIINQTEGEIIMNQDGIENDKLIRDRQLIINKLKKYNFKECFSLHNNSFWHVIENDFFKIINTKIEDGIKIINTMEQVFKNKNVKEVVIWSENGFSEQVTIELAKKKNISISLIQHGIIVDQDNERNNKFNRFSGVIPSKSDKYLVWNKLTRDYIRALGFPTRKIFEIGNSNFDNLIIDEKYLEKNYILLATTAPIKNQHAGYNSKLLEKYEQELSEMCKKIKSVNKKLIVRPHPFSQEFEIGKIVQDAYPDATIDKKTDIVTLIKNSSVVVSFGISTIIFDAHVLEKPVFFIESEHDMFGIPKYLEKNPESIIKFNDIEHHISKIYEDNSYRNSIIKMNSEIISDEFFNLGQSALSFLKLYE